MTPPLGNFIKFPITSKNVKKLTDEEIKLVQKEAESRAFLVLNFKIKDLLKEKGKFLVYPEKIEEWNKYVESDVEAGLRLYGEKCYNNLLAIMEALEEQVTINEVRNLLKKQKHSGTSEVILLNTVLEFSKRGPEFYKSYKDLPIKKDRIQEIEFENKRYVDKN